MVGSSLSLLMTRIGSWQGADWEAGHAPPEAWLDGLAVVLTVGLVTVLGALVLRAWRRGGLYRADTALSRADRERVHAAIRSVEERTVGEVLPVVVERSDRHPGSLWLAALVFALVGTAGLGRWIPWDLPALVVAAQLALGALGYLVAAALPDFQRLFVGELRATEVAEEQAFQEFYRNGLHETEARTGVLIFVSLLERRCVVLGDEGIDARVSPDQWAETDAAVLAGAARGDLAGGLVEGLEKAGAVLAEHFPWQEGDRNELPDRLVVRRE